MSKKDQEMFVSHGRITHPLGKKCKVCEKIKRAFERDLKSGKVARELRKRKSHETPPKK